MSSRTMSRAVSLTSLSLASCVLALHAAHAWSAAAVQASAGADGAQLRRHFDRKRNLEWSLTEAGVTVANKGGLNGRTIRLPGWQWVDVPYACPPDIALGPKGEALVTSNIVPTLWRIDPGTFAVTVHPLALDADRGKDVGFSAMVYSARHAAFFASSDVHGSLWKIDTALAAARKVATTPSPLPTACGLSAGTRSQGGALRLCLSHHGGALELNASGDRASMSATPCAASAADRF